MSDDEVVQHPNPERWWKIRRQGLFIGIRWSIFLTLIILGIAIWDAEIIKSISAVVGWFYAPTLVLIVGYYSNTAVEEFSKK